MKGKANGTKLSCRALYLMLILLLAVDYLAILVAQGIATNLRQHIGIISQYAIMPGIPPLYFYSLMYIVFVILSNMKMMNKYMSLVVRIENCISNF